jgi:hypothetical protein
MWEICFDVAGERHCIPVPVLIRQWPFQPHDPGPIHEVLTHWVDSPDPNPWKVDLALLSTTAALAELCVDERVKQALRSVAREQAERVAKEQLPQGVSVTFGE